MLVRLLDLVKSGKHKLWRGRTHKVDVRQGLSCPRKVLKKTYRELREAVGRESCLVLPTDIYTPPRREIET